MEGESALDLFAPLHPAAWNGRVDVVKMLLAKGANIDLKTKKGQTALDFARQKKHTDVLELLRTHGTKEQPTRDSLEAVC